MASWALALEITAFGLFALASVVLTVIDVRTHRLPDRWVLPLYPISLVLLTAAALLRAEPGRVLSAAGGAAALFAFYLVLRLANSGAMGGGDVKLAGVLGVHLGYLGWESVLFGALAGFVLGGLFAVGLLLARRGRRGRPLAFGPWMLLGCWSAIAAAVASSV